MTNDNEFTDEQIAENHRLPKCECSNPCEFSDAWRCAKDKRLPRVACDCRCHSYIHEGLESSQ